MIQEPDGISPAFVSVVVPLFNERPTLEALCRRMTVALAGVDCEFEILFVDDGSTDGSAETIRALAKSDARVRYVGLRANFGKSAALAAGIRMARGTVVVTIDADLQERPEEVGLLLTKLGEGYDVVSGWRVRRGDGWLRSSASRFYNGLLGAFSGVALHDFNCGFKCYRRAVFDEVAVYGGRHRFLPVLAKARGFRVAEIPIAHAPRIFGRSRYGWARTIDGVLGILAASMATRFVDRPTSFLAILAFAMLGLGAVVFVVPIAVLAPGPHWEVVLLTLAVLFAASTVVTVVVLATDLISSLGHREAEYTIAETSDDVAINVAPKTNAK